MLIINLSGTGVRVDYGMLKMIVVNPPVLQTMLQPDDVNLRHFKLTLFYLAAFKV